jgi:hypothetical protein
MLVCCIEQGLPSFGFSHCVYTSGYDGCPSREFSTRTSSSVGTLQAHRRCRNLCIGSDCPATMSKYPNVPACWCCYMELLLYPKSPGTAYSQKTGLRRCRHHAGSKRSLDTVVPVASRCGKVQSSCVCVTYLWRCGKQLAAVAVSEAQEIGRSRCDAARISKSTGRTSVIVKIGVVTFASSR